MQKKINVINKMLFKYNFEVLKDGMVERIKDIFI